MKIEQLQNLNKYGLIYEFKLHIFPLNVFNCSWQREALNLQVISDAAMNASTDMDGGLVGWYILPLSDCITTGPCMDPSEICAINKYHK